MDHFYNVMVALTLLVYFQISAISMLEINSDILYKKKKSFIVFPFSMHQSMGTPKICSGRNWSGWD